MDLDILKLDSEEDKNWREWIRCNGKGLSKILSEILENMANLQFSRKVTRKMLRDWKKNRFSIPIWIIKDICKQFPEEKERILSKIETVKVFGSREIKFPRKLSETLAEVIGRHCGDGSCNNTNSDFKVSLKEHLSLVKEHKKDLKKLFEIDAKIIPINEKCYEVVFRSKIFARMLEKIFKLPLGKEKTFKAEEPEIIKNAGLKIRVAFLRGLIDTDGCIKKSGVLSFTTVNEKLALSVFDILSRLSLNPTFIREKTRKVFSIQLGKEKTREFLRIVGSKNLRILERGLGPGNR